MKVKKRKETSAESRKSLSLVDKKLNISLVVVAFIIIFVFDFPLCVKADNWEYKLVNDLLRDYNPSIRPSIRHNSTLNVTFGLALAQIIDVDERNMIITTNCWLNQGWIDNKLQWNPDDYDGIQFIHIPHERIWRPDILLVNNADSWAKIASISTNAIVKFNGNVTWLSTVIFKSSCSINVRFFPFDEQQCDMIFASWTFDGYFLDIDVNSNEGDVTNYIKNGEWHLVKLMATKFLKKYSCCEEPYPEIYYRLVIRRRPLFYVFNMVFPCLLITLVAFLGFYLPPGSSEKVSIGITTLLSITVFLMLVAESMPPTSEQLPLLGIYYAVTIGLVSFSTAMAVVTLNVNNKGANGRRVPELVRYIFFQVLARAMRTELSTSRAKFSAQNDRLVHQQRNLNAQKTQKELFTLTNMIIDRKNNLVDDLLKKSLTTSINKMSDPYQCNTLNTSSSFPDCNQKIKQRDYYFESSPIIKNNRRKKIKINAPENEGCETIILEECLRTKTSKSEEINHSTTKSMTKKEDNIILCSSDLKPSSSAKITPITITKTVHISKEVKHRSNEASPQKNTDLNAEFINELDQILERQFGPLVEKILENLHNNETRLAEKQTQEMIENEWADVARVADHFFCYFFPFMTLFICAYIFFKSPYVLSNW